MSSTVPAKAEKRIKASIKKYMHVVEEALKRESNEADTSNIINDMLGDFWGYDKFFDVTSEYRIRGQFADYGVKANGKVIFFIEVKAVNVTLNENHLFQVTSYAANEGVEWVVLTNGHSWQLYHIVFGQPIDRDLVLSFNLLDKKIQPKALLSKMAYLAKESFAKNCPESLWQKRVALSKKSLLDVLSSDKVLNATRAVLRKKTGYKASPKELESMMRSIFGIS
ncbi:MAG: type I restriction enzyme HsdR N-terminal domain-containing protein [Parcubacteria group bacterium]